MGLRPWQRGSNYSLLASLLVLFAVEAAMSASSALLTVAYVAVLMVGAYSASRDLKTVVTSLAFVVPAVIARLAYIALPLRALFLVSQALGIVFLVYVVAVVFRRAVVASGRVTHERIAGSISVYLLMGVMGGQIAAAVESFSPGSFHVPDGTVADPSSLFYFAFVTLATLGYGDITPVSAPARTLSWMLAVAGQLYVATVVARLVALGIDPKRPD